MINSEHLNEIKAILILAVGVLLALSFFSYTPQDLSWFTSHPNKPVENLIGLSGASLSGAMFFIFGYSSYLLVLFIFFLSWKQFSQGGYQYSVSKIVSFLILFSVVSAFLGLSQMDDSAVRFTRAGMVGLYLSDFFVQYFDFLGSYIILFMLGVLALILTGEFLVTPFFSQVFERFQNQMDSVQEKWEGIKTKQPKKSKLVPKINFGRKNVEDEEEYDDDEEYEESDEYEDGEEEYEDDEDYDEDEEYEDDEEYDEEDEEFEPTIKITDTKKKKLKDTRKKRIGSYRLPGLDLLSDPPDVETDQLEEGLLKGAKVMEQTLASFNVSARVADIERGPAITRYELEPAPGVKVQKFTTLSDDIALAMKAPAVRIVAPIPGKNRVGVEVPNGASSAVFIKEILASPEFKKSKSKLTMALGKDISGKPIVADLAGMPHMLIAGTTGAGKTVCVNGLIISILMNASPDEVKFVMIDPKMVEMTQYQGIPHLLCPPVTDPKKATAALNWVVGEMERRYKLLASEKVRNIKSFHDKGFEMPYIVVVVDELADLMQVSAKAVEGSIARIAQLSRAVGIHLIIATQRPSVDVITGIIKANLPCRISFKVASKIDSRTVLDMNGAETLLGKGDMLILQPGDARPVRSQGNYVNDDEINAIIDHIKAQDEPEYDETIIAQQKSAAQPGGGSEEKDDLYDEATKLVIQTNQASVSILQRRMRVGYTRAARLIDMMEQDGIVGPYAGSKAREILVDREQWLLDNMASEEE